MREHSESGDVRIRLREQQPGSSRLLNDQFELLVHYTANVQPNEDMQTAFPGSGAI